MLIACLQSEIEQEVAAAFEKAKSAISLLFAVYFPMGAYFCMGAYKRDVVVVIKMGAYIHGVLILCGCLLSRFYGTYTKSTLYCKQTCFCVYKQRKGGFNWNILRRH